MLPAHPAARKDRPVNRFAALVLVCVALAACSPGAGREAFVESRLPAGLEPALWAPEGWAWGLLEPRGRPALRYGVAAPRGLAKSQVVILPGYGQTAEGWFETARALVAADHQVWILEGAGQGGSGRYGLPREVGRAPDFEADVIALAALAAQGRGFATVVAEGSAAPVAIEAASRGMRVRSIVLSGPLREAGDLAHLGRRWSRPEAGARLNPRQQAQQGWMTANPDLRTAAPGGAWRNAWRKLEERAATSERRAKVTAPVLIVAPEASPADCSGFPDCRTLAIGSDLPYPLAADAERQAWLSALLDALVPLHAL